MTPKEKAKDLYVRFSDYCSWNTFEEEQDYINNIKQCALIAVEEVKEAIFWHPYESPNFELEYWNEVMNEIEKL